MHRRQRSTTRAAPGFTIVELLIVLLVGGVLIAAAVPQFGRYQARMAAANARDHFVLMGVRARTAALERGRTVCLDLDPDAHEATLRLTGGTVIEAVSYPDELAATVSTELGTTVEICYSPRGFVPPPAAGQLPTTVTFSAGANSAEARVGSLGQIESS